MTYYIAWGIVVVGVVAMALGVLRKEKWWNSISLLCLWSTALILIKDFGILAEYIRQFAQVMKGMGV
jgi:hypothetical protein